MSDDREQSAVHAAVYAGGLFGHIELVCRDCRHAFEVVTRVAIAPAQKRCPECDSGHTRQTFVSYVRNGPLSSPRCGAPSCTSYG